MTESEIYRLPNVRPAVAMVGTSLQTMGGIATVVQGYVDAGLFERVAAVYVVTHRDGSKFVKLKVAVCAYVKVARLVLGNKVTVFHVHLSSRASFWRKLIIIGLIQLRRRPYIVHLHGSEFMEFYEKECGLFAKRMVRFVFNRADRVLSLSPEWQTKIQAISNNASIVVLPNGVPVPYENRVKPSANECPVLLFLGRLGRRKGIFDVLTALASLKKESLQFTLVAAGDGEIEEVRLRARKLGLAEHVELPGWIDSAKKTHYLKNADIFLLPSYAEGLPMSILEAMAAGVPVIGSRVGGIPLAIQDGSEGLLVEAGDVGALTQSIKRLIVNVDERLKMGDRAYSRAKREFSVENCVERLVRIYGEYGVATINPKENKCNSAGGA